MENKIMEMIYDYIKSGDFINDEDLENCCIYLYTNICNEKVIDIALEHEVYTIHCFKSFADSEVEENV